MSIGWSAAISSLWAWGPQGWPASPVTRACTESGPLAKRCITVSSRASLTLALPYSLSSSHRLMVRVPVGVGAVVWRRSVALRVSTVGLSVLTNQLRWLPTGSTAADTAREGCTLCPATGAGRLGLKSRTRWGIWLTSCAALSDCCAAMPCAAAAGGVSVMGGRATAASPVLV